MVVVDEPAVVGWVLEMAGDCMLADVHGAGLRDRPDMKAVGLLLAVIQNRGLVVGDVT